MPNVCPLCEIGILQPSVVEEVIRYDGEELRVPGVAISTCASCGEELVLPSQAKTNARLFADAKRRHDALMTSHEIADWRKQMELTQAEAARLLGGGVNAFSRYERGEIIQTRSMDLLLKVLRSVPGAREFVEEISASPVQRRRVVGGGVLESSDWKFEGPVAALVKLEAPLMFRNAANEPHRKINFADCAYG